MPFKYHPTRIPSVGWSGHLNKYKETSVTRASFYAQRFLAAQTVKESGFTLPGFDALHVRISFYIREKDKRPQIEDAGQWLIEIFRGVLWEGRPNLVGLEVRTLRVPSELVKSLGIELVFTNVDIEPRLLVPERYFGEL